MKLLAAGTVLFLLASAGVEAGIFSKGQRLPKPIDHPVVRPKVREDHKAGKRSGRHPSQLADPRWGTEWERIMSLKRHHPVPEYLKQTE